MVGGTPILLVEDSKHTALSIARAFQQAGVLAPLQTVLDVVEAIEYLSGTGIYADRSRFPLPCLLVVATKLRVRNGFDLRVWVQSQPQLQRLPKVVLSRSAEEAMLMRSLTMDSWACFIKPQTSQEWLSLIQYIRDNWLDVERLLCGSPV